MPHFFTRNICHGSREIKAGDCLEEIVARYGYSDGEVAILKHYCEERETVPEKTAEDPKTKTKRSKK